jgi:hypothetical protein
MCYTYSYVDEHETCKQIRSLQERILELAPETQFPNLNSMINSPVSTTSTATTVAGGATARRSSSYTTQLQQKRKPSSVRRVSTQSLKDRTESASTARVVDTIPDRSVYFNGQLQVGALAVTAEGSTAATAGTEGIGVTAQSVTSNDETAALRTTLEHTQALVTSQAEEIERLKNQFRALQLVATTNKGNNTLMFEHNDADDSDNVVGHDMRSDTSSVQRFNYHLAAVAEHNEQYIDRDGNDSNNGDNASDHDSSDSSSESSGESEATTSVRGSAMHHIQQQQQQHHVDNNQLQQLENKYEQQQPDLQDVVDNSVAEFFNILNNSPTTGTTGTSLTVASTTAAAAVPAVQAVQQQSLQRPQQQQGQAHVPAVRTTLLKVFLVVLFAVSVCMNVHTYKGDIVTQWQYTVQQSKQVYNRYTTKATVNGDAGVHTASGSTSSKQQDTKGNSNNSDKKMSRKEQKQQQKQQQQQQKEQQKQQQQDELKRKANANTNGNASNNDKKKKRWGSK